MGRGELAMFELLRLGAAAARCYGYGIAGVPASGAGVAGIMPPAIAVQSFGHIVTHIPAGVAAVAPERNAEQLVVKQE
jgi:hypothetical protein